MTHVQIPPWDNVWLLGAIGTSMALHFAILYFPPAAAVFGVTPLSGAEWWAVVALSAPVILVDEVLKFISRRCVCVCVCAMSPSSLVWVCGGLNRKRGRGSVCRGRGVVVRDYASHPSQLCLPVLCSLECVRLHVCMCARRIIEVG